jgi:hypothetical protein
LLQLKNIEFDNLNFKVVPSLKKYRSQNDFFLNTRPLVSQVFDSQKEMVETNNSKKQPMLVECSGEYCNLEQALYSKNIPEFHFDTLLHLTEKKQTKLELDKNILPRSPTFKLLVANKLLLLDKDIKLMWQEELLISQQINVIKNQSEAMQ